MAFQGMQFPYPQEYQGNPVQNSAANAQDLEQSYYNNMIKGAQARYAPQNEAEKYAQSQSKSFMDELEARHKKDEIDAKLALMHAQALHHEAQASPEHAARQFAPTEASKYMNEYKDAVKKHGEDSFEAKFALSALKGYKNTYGEFADKNETLSQIPGSYSLKGQPAGEINKTRAEMRADIPKAQNMIEGSRLLDDLDKLTREYPNLSESFSKIMESPNESMFASVKKLFTNPKERAALEKFRKITSDLIQKGALTFGNRGFTDARQRLIEQSKASSGLTFEANQYVIENMRHIFDEKKGRAQKDATKKGLQDNYYVPFDPEVFGEMLSKGSQSSENPSQGSFESSRSQPENSDQYSEEDILNTAREYGMTPEEVRQKLGM
jgi:hypothetical protein